MLSRLSSKLLQTATRSAPTAAPAAALTSGLSNKSDADFALLVDSVKKAGNLDAAGLAKLAASDKNLDAALRNLSSAATEFQKAQGATFEKPPVRVTVTGASGNIGYALLPRIASGEMLGPDQPVILQLLELPGAMNSLQGVIMEMNDCAFPLLRGVVGTDNVEKAFEQTDFALLVGAKPRGKGMERKDLLKDNGAIFAPVGKALNKVASRNVRVCVVGNPANTNCLIAAHNAPDLDPAQFTAMTRLDHNRALASVAAKTGVTVNDISRLAIWGNHSATQYPDLSHATINGKWAKDVIGDDKWISDTFIPEVQQRGAAIIKARGASSAASAASSAIDHIRDWMLGSNGEWTSMAIPSNGSYGCEPGVYFSQPVVCANGGYSRVMDLPIDKFSAEKIEASRKELFEERDAVAHLLK